MEPARNCLRPFEIRTQPRFATLCVLVICCCPLKPPAGGERFGGEGRPRDRAGGEIEFADQQKRLR
eukprot:13679256-Alexandrium_andersonii.AAC.1